MSIDLLDASMAPEFTGTIEEAARANLFADGMPLHRTKARHNPRYKRDLVEAARLYRRVLEGDSYARLRFVEAMSTSDFPKLFGDVLDRQLLAQYQALQPTWREFARRGTTPDFRTVKRFTIDIAGDGAELPAVAEGAPYTKIGADEGDFSYAVAKHGKRMDFSFEAMVNDDLDALERMPVELAGLGLAWEENFATQLIADSNGPHASLYVADADGNGNPNIITANPAFSIEALETAWTVLSKLRRPDGRPILRQVVKLVVPPALLVPAENVLNALTIEVQNSGGTTNQTVVAQNWMKGRLQLVVNDWFPLIITTGTRGDTSWSLFADPGTSRPAVEFGKLRGFEDPQLFQRAADSRRVGGGDEPYGFEDDSVAFKLRHIFGGTQMDKRATVASNGTGA